MLINNKQRERSDEINVNVQGTDIDCLNSIKLLGATVDNKQRAHKHHVQESKPKDNCINDTQKLSVHHCKATPF